MISTKIKFKKHTCQRKIKKKNWTLEDLALIKVPKEHREYTLKMLEHERLWGQLERKDYNLFKWRCTRSDIR